MDSLQTCIDVERFKALRFSSADVAMLCLVWNVFKVTCPEICMYMYGKSDPSCLGDLRWPNAYDTRLRSVNS